MWRRKRPDLKEFASEIASHLVNEADRLQEEGLGPQEATAAARRAFGNVTAAEERYYEAGRWVWMDHLGRDLRYALRMLVRSPGFAAVAILTLALGIGANTAIFSLIDAVLLRPLPFADPERLVLVWDDSSRFNIRDSPPSLADAMDWKARNRVFQECGIVDVATFRIAGRDRAEQVRGAIFTSGVLRALGVQPILGRNFREEDDRPGAPKTVLVSYSLWQQRFAADPNVAGQTMMIDGAPRTILGVMPAEFRFPEIGTELWTSAGSSYSAADFADRNRYDFMVVARLKSGVTIRQADGDIKRVAAELQREYPRTNARSSAFVRPMREHFVTGDVRPLLVVLAGMVGFILLIACTNIANLLLSRAAHRRREFAVRAALGAGRGNIVRQLLVENLLLAAAGGALGLAISTFSFDFFSQFVPRPIAGMTAIGVDYRVLAFTLLLASLAAVLFGLAPVLETLRLDLNHALKQAGGRGSGRRTRLRGILAAAGVAMAVVLLTGAGLMIRTFAAVRGVDPGFRTHNLLTLSTPLTYPKYADQARRNAYYEQVIERVRALPGVISAGFTTGVPLVFKGFISSIAPEGGEWGQTRFRLVTPDYLQTLGVPLRKGRFLDRRDSAAAPQVALINEAMARKFWPGREALGKRFRNQRNGPWITVAGVVGDIHQSGLDVDPNPEMYRPYEQERQGANGLVIRTAGDPMALAAAVRREIWAVDKDLAVTNVATMEQVLDREVFQRRLHMLLLGAFAALALALASLGIYGVLTCLVASRTQEIGVRVALGAEPSDILRTVVARGVLMAAVGIAVGLLAALGLTRVMSHLLFGVSPSDLATYAGVAAAGLVVAALASYLPARRAMRVDPVVALRDE